MTLLYFDWHLIPKWPLGSFFAWFPEQLLKNLVSRGSPGECSMIDHFLGDAFWGFALPGLEYRSAVWCSAADTHLKLLYCAVIGARFLTGVCLSMKLLIVDLLQFCVCCKIGCDPMHPFNDALPGPYMPTWDTHGVLVAHWCTYEPPHCRTSYYWRTLSPLSVPLERSCWFHIRWCGTDGFQAHGRCFFYWGKLLYPYNSLLLFLDFSSFCL